MITKMKKTTVSPATKKVTKLAAAMTGIAVPAPKPAAPVAPVTPEVESMAAPVTSTPLSVLVKTATQAVKPVTPAERWKMIEFEAHLLAEKHHFKGDPAAYWVQAEKNIDTKLGIKK